MTVINLEVTDDTPEGSTPIEIISVVKCLDPEGELALSIRQSGGLTEWEIIGMLTAACDAVRGSLQRDFIEKREED